MKSKNAIYVVESQPRGQKSKIWTPTYLVGVDDVLMDNIAKYLNSRMKPTIFRSTRYVAETK